MRDKQIDSILEVSNLLCKLYKKIGMVGYGDTLIDRAYSLGYIRRVPKDPPQADKFPVPRYNFITAKGRKLLAQLDTTAEEK